MLRIFLPLLLLFGAAQAYVGPGAGFGLATSFLAVLNAVLIFLLSLLLWPFITLRRSILRSRLPHRPAAGRVVVLGLDGFSPEVVRRLMAEGRLPNISRLAESGTLTELETTCPGVSPVAWTSFQTGVNPGRHGIFDFLAPDRRRYVPTLSSVETARTSRGKTVVRSLRKSRPFWQELSACGLRSAVLRVPITYPPEPLDGYLLSGMCVPDLRGSQGTYTLLGAGPSDPPGGMHRPFESASNNTWTGYLEGPPQAGGGLRITLRRNASGWSVRVGGGRGIRLEPGVVTGWTRLTFKGKELRSGARGIARMCLTSTDPPTLYISAVHPDPWSPPFPISSPVLYSKYLTGAADGEYATLGLAEDTWALMNGALDEGQFLATAWSIFEERRRMLQDGLRRIRKGLLVCVFDTPDRIQHVTWRQGTGEGSPVGEMYARMDSLVGETAALLSDKDLLIVMSDHGFTSFDECLDLNRFLYDEGFLVLEQGISPPREDLSNVDWERSTAYSMGLAGVLLNLKGREGRGCVEPRDAETILSAIERKLLALTSPGGAKPVRAVYRASRAYNGPYVGRAPDLIVGTAAGFRASWHCVTGGIGDSVLHPNPYRWTGDHCHDHTLVPGILLSNRKLQSPACITDIAPTVLRALGLSVPAHMEGRVLLEGIDE